MDTRLSGQIRLGSGRFAMAGAPNSNFEGAAVDNALTARLMAMRRDNTWADTSAAARMNLPPANSNTDPSVLKILDTMNANLTKMNTSINTSTAELRQAWNSQADHITTLVDKQGEMTAAMQQNTQMIAAVGTMPQNGMNT